MTYSWYRIIQFMAAVIIPGGLGFLLLLTLWRQRAGRADSREVLASASPGQAQLGGTRARAGSLISVPKLVGPPYVYTENLRK